MSLFHTSKTLKNFSQFTMPTRTLLDLFLINKTCEYFSPTTVTEIGFCQGLTLGVLVESCSRHTKFYSIDTNFDQRSTFDSIFQDKLDKIQFINEDSLTVNFATSDLILVDGAHDYKHVKNDIEKSLMHIGNSGILIIDDALHGFPGVTKAVEEYAIKKGWIPFMAGDQTLWLHHNSHTADEFLDEYLPNIANNFIDLSNKTIFDHTVMQASTFNIFSYPEIFKHTCKVLNI